MDPRESREPMADPIDAELEFHFAEVVDALMAQGFASRPASAAHALAGAIATAPTAPRTTPIATWMATRRRCCAADPAKTRPGPREYRSHVCAVRR